MSSQETYLIKVQNRCHCFIQPYSIPSTFPKFLSRRSRQQRGRYTKPFLPDNFGPRKLSIQVLAVDHFETGQYVSPLV